MRKIIRSSAIAATPDGTFQTILPIAVTGEAPGMTTCSVHDLKPYDGHYNYLYMRINWQNLETGAAGDVDLRYWGSPARDNPDPSYPASLPTSAAAETATGPIVAEVTHHNYLYQSPPSTLSPGYWAFWA